MHEQTKRLVEMLDKQEFSTDAELYASMPYTRRKLVESLDAMEECCMVTEIESKSWHDFWVVQRAMARALFIILTWILKKDKA